MFYQKCGDVFLSSTLFFFYRLVNIWIFVNLVWPFGIVIHEVSGASCPEPGSLLSKTPSHLLVFYCTNGYFEGSLCMLENCIHTYHGGFELLTGSKKITCTNTGRRLEWTYSPTEGRPACPGGDRCQHPGNFITVAPAHLLGVGCTNGYLEGSNCMLSFCKHPLWHRDDRLTGSRNLTCTNTGSRLEWTYSPTEGRPACAAARCTRTWTDEFNHDCNNGSWGVGTVCNLSCKGGDKPGNKKISMTCNTNGGVTEWTSSTTLDKLACPKGRCSEPARTDEFYFKCSTVDFVVGTVCKLSCRYGDYQQNKISMYCNMTGNLMEWTSSKTLAELACPKAVNCTLLQGPKNGSLACLRDSFGVLCMVICNFGFEVPRKTDGRFMCTFSKGYWQPNTHIPSCSRLLQPNVTRMMTDLQYHYTDCSNSNATKNVFLKALRNSTWRDACLAMTCNVDNVVVVCDRSNLIIDYWKDDIWYYDYRRQKNPHIANLSSEIVLGTDSSTVPAADLYQSIMSTKDSIFNTLNSEAQSGKFNMPSGTVTYGFKYPTIKAECPPGMLGKDTGKSLSCVGCGTGYYLPARADKCEPCPVGQYTDLEWATSCTPCPTGKSTLSTGSSQLSDCKVLGLL